MCNCKNEECSTVFWMTLAGSIMELRGRHGAHEIHVGDHCYRRMKQPCMISRESRSINASELLLHSDIKWDMSPMHISALNTHGVPLRCCRFLKILTMIGWPTMLFYCSRAVFAKDFQLGYAGTVYKCTNHTWCTISML